MELNKDIIEKAYRLFVQQEKRKEALKAPHKNKLKSRNRAKNKVARKSRKANR